jgi:hypothetical protein
MAGLVKEIMTLKYDTFNSVACFFSLLLFMLSTNGKLMVVEVLLFL